MRPYRPTEILLAALLGSGCSDADSPAEELDPDATTGPDEDLGSDATPTGSSRDVGRQEQNLPCDVEALFAHNCWSCHDDPPRFGAPMPLRDLTDVSAPLPSDPATSVAAVLVERIEDPIRPMPPTGRLEEDERRLLARWLAAGAPPGDDAHCEIEEPDPVPEIGPEALPCEPSHEFLAHGSDDSTPFHVPDVDDLYTCFNFEVPFEAQTQAVAWAPVIDDHRVLHHFILYSTSASLEPGAVGPCQIPEDATYVGGWAPGRANVELPPDVGLELPDPGGTLILEIHYNNIARHDDALDRSGMALCTVAEPRTSTAGFIRVGTFDIDIPPGARAHQEVGVCPTWQTRELGGTVDILSVFPHMHELGRSLRTEILRDGDEAAVEVLVDVPEFSFDNQVGYDLEPFVRLDPGDELRTTCAYDNPGSEAVRYGPGTTDEMCFNRLLVHPVDEIPWRDCVH